jgi:hypothetical protein
VRPLLPLLRSLACVGFLALSVPAGAGEDAPAVAALKRCVVSVHGQSLRGLESFQARCPELKGALAELGLSGQLGVNWQSRLTTRSLEGIVALADRYQGQPAGAAPDVAALAAAMQSLEMHQHPDSWWQRFKTWLSSWLRSPEVRSRDNGWLQRLLARIDVPPALARAIGYVSVGLLLAFALYVLLRELRLSGMLARGPQRRLRPLPTTPRLLERETPLDPAQLQALPAWQQPAAVLRLLVQVLHRTGRLSGERALTHRELIERARLDETAQRERFQRVARLAERQVYGLQEPGESAAVDAALRAVVADGLSLHGELSSAARGVA